MTTLPPKAVRRPTTWYPNSNCRVFQHLGKESCTLAELLAILPAGVDLEKIEVEYAGCGSHDISLYWPEPVAEPVEAAWSTLNADMEVLQTKRDAALEAAHKEYSVALKALVNRGIHELAELNAVKDGAK